MSLDYFRAEKGLHLTGENLDVGAHLLFGSGAPSLDADVGSLYMRTDVAQIWRKIAAGAGSGNWERQAELADIGTFGFRSERVVAVTSQAAPANNTVIDLAATPLTGDEGTTLSGANFTANVSHIIFGYGGTEKLMKVSVVSGDNITVTDVGVVVLSAGNGFVAENFLPDSPDAQEGSALVWYNGTDLIKIGDVNWSLADGINLTSGYSAAVGNVAPNDTVQAAIAKLDGVNDAQDSLLGTSQGATDLGSFTGTTIPDNSTVKGALQSLETAVEAIVDLTKSSVTGVTTIQTLDSVNVDSYQGARWWVVASLDSNPARKQGFEVFAIHDGTPSADAAGTDHTVYGKLKLGSNFNVDLSIDLNGTGAGQVMRLRATAAAGISLKATRLEVNS